MEFTAFTCQFCAEHQEWDTREAADSAAVWHLFDEHPLRWFAVAGNTPRPTRRRGGWVTGWSPDRT